MKRFLFLLLAGRAADNQPIPANAFHEGSLGGQAL
jgi:hypothetical protein